MFEYIKNMHSNILTHLCQLEPSILGAGCIRSAPEEYFNL